MALRLVFFGTPGFAVPSLDGLVEAGHDVQLVVTQPDRPQGRRQQIVAPAVKLRAVEQGIAVFQPERIREAEVLDRLRAVQADLAVVAAYGQLLPQNLLDLPHLGFLNVHASLLPRWRGAAPVHRAIMAGDTESGVTIMKVVLALDAGPMLARVKTPIDPNETAVMLEGRLARLGATLLVQALDQLERGAAELEGQGDDGVTYAPKLGRADGVVNWGRTGTDIHNQIRGLHPWPLAETHYQGRRLLLLRSALRETGSPQPAPGTIRVDGTSLFVGCGDRALEILELQPDNGRPMRTPAFLRGHRLRTGESFEGATSGPQ